MPNNKVIHVDEETHTKIGKMMFDGGYDTMGAVVKDAVEQMELEDTDNRDEDLKSKEDFDNEQDWFAYKRKHDIE